MSKKGNQENLLYKDSSFRIVDCFYNVYNEFGVGYKESIYHKSLAVELMPKIYEKQLYNYLKGTKYKLGYLINFGSDKIDIRRRIHEKIKLKQY